MGPQYRQVPFPVVARQLACHSTGYVRGIRRVSSTFNASRKDSHSDAMSSGTGSSQSNVLDVSFRKISFPWIITGAKNPRGSYILLTVEVYPVE
jgi:hypothetical protein